MNFHRIHIRFHTVPSILLTKKTNYFIKPQHFIHRIYYSSIKTIINENIINNGNHQSIRRWLIGSMSLVASSIIIGAVMRITRSNIPMTKEWESFSKEIILPLSNTKWIEKFNIYLDIPSSTVMTLEEFKKNYIKNYINQMMEIINSAVFFGPFAYFLAGNKIPTNIYRPLTIVAAIFTIQIFTGQILSKRDVNKPDYIKVDTMFSPYRFLTHVGLEYGKYIGLLWALLKTIDPEVKKSQVLDPLIGKKLKTLHKLTSITIALLGCTIIAGALVAANDAGSRFNTFPKMNGKWIPDDLFPFEPKLKNFFENIPLVQFDHRILAYSTLYGVIAIYLFAKRPMIWAGCSEYTKNAINFSLGAVAFQAGVGITTVLTQAPSELSAIHQAGALALLTSLLCTSHSLRHIKIPSTHFIQNNIKNTTSSIKKTFPSSAGDY